MASALTEKQDSRTVVKTNDKIRVTLLYYSVKANFVQGANGWVILVNATSTGTVTPTIGTLISALKVIDDPAVVVGDAMTWSGYDTPACIYMDAIPRWTAAKGFVRMVFEGDAVWAD
ncbi:MAG: hypothetical protein IMZ62_08075 [Chloroflexi bacterium]|nr:hypothetical protein [Chloroflexota bacterium]MBE3118778.1 hypothetical protein [Candidatus Atribacteria bacterium]